MVKVAVRGLGKRFGRIEAVTDLTFELPEGRVTGFLGPNGAGKTTTLRMMLGLVRPTGGEALIGGRPYRRLEHPQRVVGAVLEAAGFHPGRTGRNHLRIAAAAGRIPAARVAEIVDETGIGSLADRPVGEYSLGQRQRLGLAVALLGDPAVFLLDEPANGLDPEGIAWLRRRLKGFAAEGRTVLISSHVLSEIAQTADHVVIVSRGRLRFAGPLDALGNGPQALEDAFLRLTGSDLAAAAGAQA